MMDLSQTIEALQSLEKREADANKALQDAHEMQKQATAMRDDAERALRQAQVEKDAAKSMLNEVGAANHIRGSELTNRENNLLRSQTDLQNQTEQRKSVLDKREAEINTKTNALDIRETACREKETQLEALANKYRAIHAYLNKNL